jgi:hypothetical protein
MIWYKSAFNLHKATVSVAISARKNPELHYQG